MKLRGLQPAGPAPLASLFEQAEQKARDKARRRRARPRPREPRTLAEARAAVAEVLAELPRPDGPVVVPPRPADSPLDDREWAQLHEHRERTARARRIQEEHRQGLNAMNAAHRREQRATEKRRRRAARLERPVQRGGRLTWEPREVVSPQYVNQVDLDGEKLEAIAKAPEARRLLNEKRASHQRLRTLTRPALAILETLGAFRHGLPADQANGHASLGVQWGVEAGWVPFLGYSRSEVFRAQAELEGLGLIVRYSQSITVTHLTRNRPAEEQVDTWLDAAGNEHDDVQTYTIVYLTHAGAELLDGLGFDVGGRGAEPGRPGWVQGGFSVYVRQLLQPLARVVLRRVGALLTTPTLETPTQQGTGSAASENRTPLTPLRGVSIQEEAQGSHRGAGEGEERAPEGAASPDRPCPAPPAPDSAQIERAVVAPSGRSALGQAVPESGAVPPPLATDAKLAAWHGLTAEGYREGLTWEGGGLAAFAEVVALAWSRARRVRPTRPEEDQARAPSSERHRGEVAPSDLCPGCRAAPPSWQGYGAARSHGPGCPTRARWLPPGVDHVWAPAMTAADWYWAAWRHRPEERPRLAALFAPVQRELWRRREAFEAARAAAETPGDKWPTQAGFDASVSETHTATQPARSSAAPAVPRTKAEAQAVWGGLLARVARARVLP